MATEDNAVTDMEFVRALRQERPPAPKVSWRALQGNAPMEGLSQPTYDPTNAVMYSWGPLQFKIWPLNIHEFDHETDTDWAQKEIAGSAIFREWVGENDENLYFRGKLFPYRIGGMAEMELMEATRRRGIALALIRATGHKVRISAGTSSKSWCAPINFCRRKASVKSSSSKPSSHACRCLTIRVSNMRRCLTPGMWDECRRLRVAQGHQRFCHC